MATITTNTQLKLINQLSDIDNIGGGDLILIQRGLKSYKSNYSNFINGLVDNITLEVNGDKLSVKSTIGEITDGSIGLQKLGQLSENTVIGNVSGGNNPEEIQIIQDLNSGTANNIASSSAIVQHVSQELSTISDADNLRVTGVYGKNTVYTNSNGRKIMVIAVIDGGNDIYGFTAHIGETEAAISGKDSSKGTNGRDSSTCTVYEHHVSDSSADDATTITFIVPDTWRWKITGDANVKQCWVWEI